MSDYKGVLKRKFRPITILGANPSAMKIYTKAVNEREIALFQHFNIDSEHPNAWRDLALALAKKHVPAFSANKGRPPTNKDEDFTWWLIFQGVKRRDKCTNSAAYQVVSNIVNIEVDLIYTRLKSFKKQNSRLVEEFDICLDNIEAEIGHEECVQILLEAGEIGPDFKAEFLKQVAALKNFPY